MLRRDFGKKIVWAAGACLWAMTAWAQAAEQLSIDVHSSKYMSMPAAITQLAVGDPNIATVVEVPDSSRDFLIVTHEPGSTSLIVWTVTGARYEYLIGVSPEDAGQAKVIEQAIGLPDVHVRMVGGKVLLSGTVENQYERNYAMRTAQLFCKESNKTGNISVGSNVDMKLRTQNSLGENNAGTIGGNEVNESGSVIDLLHMRHPYQIRLEAQVVALNPEDEKNLGFLYGTADGSDLLKAPGIFYAGDSYGSGDTSFRNNPGRWLTDHRGDLNMALRALVTNSKAKILSRPSITTMSGEAAVIQVGGEIPYTTRDSNGNPRTEFKDYGIILQFKPVVDAQGRIVSTVHTEVSMPSGDTVEGQPVLDRRRADTVVTVDSGTTMVIGGLMDSRDYKTVRKFPFLGDIPVIGEFFKYTSHSRDKQEMIILVTPRLVDESNSSKVRMSKDMRQFYDKGRKETAAQEEVDVNEPLPEPETAGTDKKVNKAQAKSETAAQVAAEAAR